LSVIEPNPNKNFQNDPNPNGQNQTGKMIPQNQTFVATLYGFGT